MERFRVTVGKDDLYFAAGHFIPFGGECESLHGHNYRIAVTLEGRKNEVGYVYDFIALRRAVKEVVAPLDHRMLLPTESPHVQVVEEEGEVTARCRGHRYLFPRSDVALLPVLNTTAELIAGWLAEALLGRLAGERADGNLERLVVEVEESPGQSGWCVRELA
jgi:6-pyruvoyltetrahydropterin/6-carboxytetrahydropterin synthase